jgi:CHAT domain-containing protein
VDPIEVASAEPQTVEDEIRRDLRHAREAGDMLQAARLLRRLGVRSARRREFEAASSWVNEAIDFWANLADPGGELELASSLYRDLGVYQAELGELDHAEGTLQVALLLCDGVGLDGEAASVLGTLAFVAHTRRHYGEALRYMEDQFERQRRPGAHVSRASRAITYNNYAALLNDIGETGQALQYYREAYHRHSELGAVHSALIALLNEATLHDEEGRDATAARTYERVREEAKKAGAVAIEIAALSHLGLLLTASPERRADGEAAVREALTISKTAGDARTVALCKLNLARAIQESDPAGAERLLRIVSAEFATLDERSGQVQALTALAELLRSRGVFVAADDAAEQAIALFESNRAELDAARVPLRFAELQRTYLAEHLVIYDEHCIALVRRGLAEVDPAAAAALLARAFMTGERRRARELSQLLATVDKTPIPATPRLSEVRSLLDEHSAVLAFVTCVDASVCFALTRRNLAAFVIPNKARLKRWVDGLRAWCDSESQPPPMFAHELHDALLAGPLRFFTDLRLSIDRLLIIPDGPLHALPFGCLPLGPDPWPVVTDAYEVEITPSCVVALQLEERRAMSRAARGFVGIGNASIATTSGKDSILEGTTSEVEMIAQLLRESGVEPIETLTDERCTRREAIRCLERPAGGWHYVHFATHGILNLDAPEMSGLLLSAEPGRDPLWRAGDIAARRIPCNLVVLNACETVRGKNVAGEGSLGVARAFLVAGAESVCASLWEVPDDATSRLICHLYAHLANGERPAQALRSAQRDVRMEGFEHPVNWAGLEVIR